MNARLLLLLPLLLSLTDWCPLCFCFCSCFCFSFCSEIAEKLQEISDLQSQLSEVQTVVQQKEQEIIKVHKMVRPKS